MELWLVVGREIHQNKLVQLYLLSNSGERKQMTVKQFDSFSNKNKVVNVKSYGEQLQGVGISLLSIPTYQKNDMGQFVQTGGTTEQSIINAAQPFIEKILMDEQKSKAKQKESDADKMEKISTILCRLKLCGDVLNELENTKDLTNEQLLVENVSRYIRQLDVNNSDDSVQNMIAKYGITGLVHSVDTRIERCRARAEKYGLLSENIMHLAGVDSIQSLCDILSQKVEKIKNQHKITYDIIKEIKNCQEGKEVKLPDAAAFMREQLFKVEGYVNDLNNSFGFNDDKFNRVKSDYRDYLLSIVNRKIRDAEWHYVKCEFSDGRKVNIIDLDKDIQSIFDKFKNEVLKENVDQDSGPDIDELDDIMAEIEAEESDEDMEDELSEDLDSLVAEIENDEQGEEAPASVERSASSSENITNEKIISDEDNEFREAWESFISEQIKGLLSSFRALYSSCYSGITAPDGILTNEGLLSFENPVNGKVKGEVLAEAHKKADTNGNRRAFILNHGKIGQQKQYLSLYNAVMYAYGVLYGSAKELEVNLSVEEQKAIARNAIDAGDKIFGRIIDGRKDTLPKWEDVSLNQYMYPRLHVEFMTGLFDTSKEMREWSRKNNITCSRDKITSYDSMEKWIKKRLFDCNIQALKDYKGRNGEVITVNSDPIDSLPICQKISNSIKNIIAVTANKKGFKTIKICSNVLNADGKRIAEKIQSYLTWSTAGSSSIEVILKGIDSDVIELDIVTSKADYESSSAFASSVIDDIMVSGQIPSWDNAILGEKNEGGAFTYNFKDKGSISIYGSSGSGKGIMTSALLSNAIVDNCYVFYFDGKPDNGAALGKVAWDKGKEAAVFNGIQGSCATFPNHLEEYSHGIRPVTWRSLCDQFIPEIKPTGEAGEVIWPFNDEMSKKQLIEVSYTLQAFQFVHDMILLRTEPQFVKDRWAVFVIDEIQDAAMNEKQIRAKMKEYLDAVGEQDVYKTETDSKGVSKQKKDGKIKDRKNWEKDTGYLFCQRWLSWANNCCSQWDNIATKALRMSKSTLITIFQDNAWFTQDDKGAGKSKIGQLMLKISAKTIKIVGKGALKSENQWGDKHYRWEKETAKGKWVIARNEGGLSEEDYIYRPFKCFTTDLGKDIVVPVNDFGAGATECRKYKNDNGKDPIGIQSYLIYLFNGMQEEIQNQINNGKRLPGSNTAEDVLQTSFNYFDSVVRTPGKAFMNDEEGLLHFMYSISAMFKSGNDNIDSFNSDSDNTEGHSSISENLNYYNSTIQDGFDERNSFNSKEQTYGQDIGSKRYGSPVDNQTVNNEAYSNNRNFQRDNGGTVTEGPGVAKSAFSEVNGEIVVDRQQLKTPLIELNDVNFIDTPNDYGIDKVSNILLKSNKGRSYIFDNRIDSVIKAIDAAIPDRNAVRRISTISEQLIVNGRLVNVYPLMNVEYGIRFEDIVSIKKLINTYKYIHNLQIDSTMFDQVVLDFDDGNDTFGKIFKLCPMLQWIEVQYTAGARFDRITRRDYVMKTQKVKAETNRSKHKQQIEFCAALQNPRLIDMGIGYTQGAFKVSESLGAAMKKKLTSKNPKIFGGLGYGILASLALGSGVVVGITSGLAKGFFDILNKARR